MINSARIVKIKIKNNKRQYKLDAGNSRKGINY